MKRPGKLGRPLTAHHEDTMTTETFGRALALVLKHEGGYVDHPKDPGGATNLGVTIGTLSDWLGRKATKAEVKALKPATVAPIYRKRYWDAARCDTLPAGVDYAVFDFAVNSGVSRSVMALQRAVGVADDGKIGPITLWAISKADPELLISRLCTDRLSFLMRLSTWKSFGKGWRSRVQGVEREALKMAAPAQKRAA
jgi:lysozyme family protein